MHFKNAETVSFLITDYQQSVMYTELTNIEYCAYYISSIVTVYYFLLLFIFLTVSSVKNLVVTCQRTVEQKDVISLVTTFGL